MEELKLKIEIINNHLESVYIEKQKFQETEKVKEYNILCDKNDERLEEI